MTSAINPQNINGAYPVAGQDNDSQGFRDNFTSTRNNFQLAKDEISDLQAKVVLKAPLTGTTLNNNMGGQVLSNAELRNITESVISLGSVTGSAAINYAVGSYYTLSTNGNVTLAFSGLPATGKAATWIVRVTVSSVAHTLQLPAAVSGSSVQGIQGIDSNIITFAETGTYEFQFDTSDGGSTIFLTELTRPRNRWTNPLFLDIPQLFAANGNVSLSTTTTVITSAGDLVGNLAAGSSGQIKILTYDPSTSGNTQITVANAAWGGNNTATISTVGSAATFQYINSKWICIGNNGVVFS